MNIENEIFKAVKVAVKELYGQEVADSMVQIQKTKSTFEGNLTVVVFPFLKISKKKPEDTAQEIGEYLKQNCSNVVADFNVVKGFLNLCIAPAAWVALLNTINAEAKFGEKPVTENSPLVMIEYSSPNTNKPLHLGHVRNNLLGWSLAQIMEANGNKVIKTNIVNDRGIHICKSMLAWLKWGNGETPETSGKKGDHLIGDYYVAFDKHYREEIAELKAQYIKEGMEEEAATEKAKAEAPLIKEAHEMLVKWENNDPEVRALWEKMNNWVYAGFDETYKMMGVGFDKIYYESNTYFPIDKMIYVVGNEQNYHFQVLSILLDRLGFKWGKDLVHFSYGMVELPNGKMKSREGTVVDADDLMEAMITDARQTSDELGKFNDMTEEEKQEIARIVGLGALKYFILKVDARKNMLFNPEESIDFNGNTGPFIQYTYARIRSIMRKAAAEGIVIPAELGADAPLNEKEIDLIQKLNDFGAAVAQAGIDYSPSGIANYCYELTKQFNQFYHDYSILNADSEAEKTVRLVLAANVAKVIKNGMELLGIEVPERM